MKIIRSIAGTLPILAATLTPAQAATITVSPVAVVGTGSGDQVTRWRTPTVVKTADPDGDNIYGTMGAVLWGDGATTTLTPQTTRQTTGTGTGTTFGWEIIAQTVSTDIGIGLQNFQHESFTDIDNLTGGTATAPGLTSISGGNGTLTIQFNGTPADYSGKIVRLGILHDYQDAAAVNNINKQYTLAQTVGGSSSATLTAITRDSNPDLYFFDLTGISPGDQFTLTSHANPAGTGSGGLASIPALALDIAATPTPPTYEVTMGKLLDQVIDREELARLPSFSRTIRQSSSRDPLSNDPNNTTTWHANTDWDNFVATETINGRTEYVMLEETGPGALVRFWAAGESPFLENKIVRVYIDGNLSQPAIEMPILDLMSRGQLVAAPLSEALGAGSDEHRKGYNLYLPVPFAQSCKVTYQGPKSQPIWYNINCVKFAPGTTVESYSPAIHTANALKIANVNSALSASTGSGVPAVSATPLSGVLPAGERLSATLTGAAAVRRLTFKLGAADIAQAMRSTVLEITFDGTRTVWCPLGDFFGVGYTPATTANWSSKVEADGTMTCAWVMPFQTSAKIDVVNHGLQSVTLETGLIESAPWTWDARSMYFHADWREYNRIDTRPLRDLNYVTLTGQGVYVGDSLTLFNGAVDGATNRWWGEGDERIYIDGAAFPNHFGTGTEDYYGYAWGRDESFTHPFLAQPLGTANKNIGKTTNSRFRVLDAIPFSSQLRVDMELWTWQSSKLNFAPTVFWYGRPGAVSNITPVVVHAQYKVVQSLTDLNSPAAPPEPPPVNGGSVSYRRTVSGTEVARWRTASVLKSYDIDSDQIYGTLGAVIWGSGTGTGLQPNGTIQSSGVTPVTMLGWQMVGQTVNPDLGVGLQHFQHEGYADIDNLAGGTATAPGVASISPGNGTLTISFNGIAADYEGMTVRLGIMHDYQQASDVNNINKEFKVQKSGGGDFASVVANTRDGAPDILFFDLTAIAPGDQVTITAYANPATTNTGGLASIPVVFLDLGGVTSPADADGDGLLDVWETAHALSIASGTGNDGPTGDPDGDGATNLHEFAFGGDPHAASDRGPSQSTVVDLSGERHFAYTFAALSGVAFGGTGPLSGSRDGVDYEVTGSGDLTTFALSLTEVTPAVVAGLPAAPAGYSYHTIRLTDPVSTVGAGFIRAKSAPTPASAP